MVVFVRIPESVTRPLAVRMLLVMLKDQEILAVVGHAILFVNVRSHERTTEYSVTVFGSLIQIIT
jgi:hypothetical protein